MDSTINDIVTERRVTHWCAYLASAPGVYRTGSTKDEAIARLLAFLRDARGVNNG